MATRLEELGERLAALEGEAGYGAYGEEAYAPYEEEEEEAAPYEEEPAGALEEAFEGMSEEEIGSFSDTLEALETGQLRLEDLSQVEQMGLRDFFRKFGRVFRRIVRPIWRIAKPVLRRYLPFEEEMGARGMPRGRCPPGYRTLPVTGWRCMPSYRPSRPSYRPSYRPPMRPPLGLRPVRPSRKQPPVRR